MLSKKKTTKEALEKYALIENTLGYFGPNTLINDIWCKSTQAEVGSCFSLLRISSGHPNDVTVVRRLPPQTLVHGSTFQLHVPIIGMNLKLGSRNCGAPRKVYTLR